MWLKIWRGHDRHWLSWSENSRRRLFSAKFFQAFVSASSGQSPPGCLFEGRHGQNRTGMVLQGRQRGHSVYVADELARARQALAELVGEQTTEVLLGEIFSSFCVGK